MNEDFSEIVVTSITSKTLKSVLNGLELSLSVTQKCLSLIIIIVDGKTVVLVLLSNLDVSELNFILAVLCVLWSAAKWLDKEHEWYANNREDQQGNGC